MKVLTIGTFDLFHPGHVYLLRRCAEHGPVHVGVNTDRFVAKYKGRAPVESQDTRFRRVNASRWVYGTHFNDGPGRELIEEVRPNLLVIGSDWLGRGYLSQIDMTRERMQEMQCDLLFISRLPGFSSSALRGAA